MKKLNGFTLIELLAVIIILAVVALIATPVILNVVEDTKNQADLRTVDGLIDGGKQFCANAMFNTDNEKDIENGSNVYDKIIVSGSKPSVGDIFVNDKCQVALKVVQNKKCYIKYFDSNVEVKEESLCNDFVGKDEVIPTVIVKAALEPVNGWYKESFRVNINVIDNESGPANYKWCSDSKECTPNVTVNSASGFVNIQAEGDNMVCVIGKDKSGKESITTCSEVFKLDFTVPIIEGIADIIINKDGVVDLTTGVITNDNLSGIKGLFDHNPKVVDTSIAGVTEITYTVSDNAGNIKEVKRKVIIDADSPTVTYTPLGDKINVRGWAKENYLVKVDLVDNSGLGIKSGKWCSTNIDTCEPIAVITGTTLSPKIEVEGSNRICVKATDNNNKTSETICSDVYKLDKTAPTAGTINVVGTMGSNSWYTSNATITANNGSDGLSGHSATTTNIPNITDNTASTTITLITTDLAGNTSTRTQTIKIDKIVPTLSAKSDAIEITMGDSLIASNYFNTPVYGISGGSMTCNPTNVSELKAGIQSISCTATSNSGLSTTATISNVVVNIIYEDCFTFDIASATITGYSTLPGCHKDVVLPKQLKGVDVKRIGKSAFSSKELTSLDFSKMTSLETIENSAFAGNSLLGTLDLSPLKSLVAIGNSAFAKCGLTNVNLDGLNNLKYIGATEYSIPEVYNYRFVAPDFTNSGVVKKYGCRGGSGTAYATPPSAFSSNELTTINLDLPNLIYLNGFNYNRNLTEIRLNVPNLVYLAGFVTAPITSFDFSNLENLRVIGNNAFKSSSISNLDLSNLLNLEKIDNGAFGWTQVTAVSLNGSQNLRYIGERAFFGNILNTVDIRNTPNLQYINSEAFGPTTNFYYDSSNLIKYLGIDLTNREHLVYTKFKKAVEMYSRMAPANDISLISHSDLRVLGSGIFNNSDPAYIVLPNSLEYIEGHVFGKPSATAIIIPSAVKVIGKEAFGNKLIKANISGDETRFDNQKIDNDCSLNLSDMGLYR